MDRRYVSAKSVELSESEIIYLTALILILTFDLDGDLALVDTRSTAAGFVVVHSRLCFLLAFNTLKTNYPLGSTIFWEIGSVVSPSPKVRTR